MHIEPGLVDGSKIVLSYATGAGVAAYTAKLAWESLREQGLFSLAARSAIATAAVFSFFEILPHVSVGVSELHLILGSTLFLILGMAPAAIGLALGLLIQGLFFEPSDLPQYGMNVTTLLASLFALQFVAKRIIAPHTAYVDLKYWQALALSTAFQGGIVAWVAFWALYGKGFGAENLNEIVTFGASYMLVLVLEPLIDLAVLAVAKLWRSVSHSAFVTPRLYSAQ